VSVPITGEVLIAILAGGVAGIWLVGLLVVLEHVQHRDRLSWPRCRARTLHYVRCRRRRWHPGDHEDWNGERFT
jgi:hypothetical protein